MPGGLSESWQKCTVQRMVKVDSDDDEDDYDLDEPGIGEEYFSGGSWAMSDSE